VLFYIKELGGWVMKIQGVWVPLITPFKEGKIDYLSYKRLMEKYINDKVSGLIPLGTTGESPNISEREYEELVEKTMEFNNSRVPIVVGLGGNNTKKVIEKLSIAEKNKVQGILSTSPYYNRPDQRGIFQHFKAISEATTLDIIVYNIPYRTGRNIENETIYKLAELKNIVGLKDSCGDINQTTRLLLNPPKDFSILTGEDVLFYTTLLLGGDGGIMATAHLKTKDFIKVYELIKDNNHQEALKIWKKLYRIIPLLFEEPNPAPLKYVLNKIGLIDSPEIRLPLLEITDELKNKLDKVLGLEV
jgi:4-hydroxy-tetrahydrodipicolinate synthase